MADTPHERYLRAERTSTELIKALPKAVLGPVARMLAQALAHHRMRTGVELPIEATTVMLNSPRSGPLDREALDALDAEALEELVSLLAWQAGELEIPPSSHPRH